MSYQSQWSQSEWVMAKKGVETDWAYHVTKLCDEIAVRIPCWLMRASSFKSRRAIIRWTTDLTSRAIGDTRLQHFGLFLIPHLHPKWRPIASNLRYSTGIFSPPPTQLQDYRAVLLTSPLRHLKSSRYGWSVSSVSPGAVNTSGAQSRCPIPAGSLPNQLRS